MPTTLVLCHGSYHTPAPYEQFLTAVERDLGFETHCPQLPSSDLTKLDVGDVNAPDFERPPPSNGYPGQTDDAAVVRTLLTRLIEEDHKEVLIAAHSSGGWTATEAAVPALQRKKRREAGLDGGIIGILYITAFVAPLGKSLAELAVPDEGSQLPAYVTIHSHGLAGLFTPKNAAHNFMNDLNEAEAERWARTLTAQSACLAQLTNEPYADLPCGYVFCGQDLALPVALQREMVATSSAASKTKFIEFELPTASHAPFLSCIPQLVGFAKQFEQTAQQASG